MKIFKNNSKKINTINNKINEQSNKILDYFKAYKFEIWLVILSVIAFLIHYHLAATLNLGNDEAHYYVWSLHLSPGYLDDAPLAAYCIYFFTHILGKSELTVRLTAIIFSFFDGFLIYYFTYLLFKDKRASFFAFLFFLCSPIFGFILSVMILPDTPLLFFYLLFLISFYIAANKMNNSCNYSRYNFIYDSEKPDKVNKKINKNSNNTYFNANANAKFNIRYTKWWVIAGIFLGLSFLSKYTAALIPPSALLYLLFSNKNRYLLKTIYPYFTLLMAIIVFFPVIYWNLIHNFISFKFQLSHGFSSPTSNAILFFQNWLEQFIAISPLIYIILFFVFIYYIFYIVLSKSNKKYILKKYNNDDNDGIVNKYNKYNKDADNSIQNPVQQVQQYKRFNKHIKKNNEHEKDIINESILFALSMSVPMLVFFIINGYSHRILFHWPDIGYLSAFPLAGFFISSAINKYINLYNNNNSGKYPKIVSAALPPRNKISEAVDYIKSNNRGKYSGSNKLSFKNFLNLSKLNSFKFFIYIALFIGFFMSMVLYFQIYYNFIPVSNIISYVDKEHGLHKGGIFKLIPHIPGKAKTADITDDLFGWKASAKYLKIVYFGYKSKYPSLFLLTHHYAISDELVFYGKFKPAFEMKPDIYNISGFLNQYDIWQNKNKLHNLNGKDALFVMDNKYMINPVSAYLKYFKSIKFVGRLDIYKKFMPVREFYIYFMKDFNTEYALRHMSKRLY